MNIQDFSWNLEIFWFWVEQALIWALFYYYFVQSAKTVIFCAEIDSRGIFFCVFHKIFKDFQFSWNFYVIFRKNAPPNLLSRQWFHMKLSKSRWYSRGKRGFWCFGPKITKFSDFHEKLVFCSPNHNFPPPVSNHQ